MTKLGKQNQLRLFGLLFGAMACLPVYATGAGNIELAQISIKPESLLPMPGCGGALVGGTPCTSITISPFPGSASITITNTSPAIAYGISATIDPTLVSICGVSVYSNSCTPSLNPGTSCAIFFSATSVNSSCANLPICISGTNIATPVCIPASAT